MVATAVPAFADFKKFDFKKFDKKNLQFLSQENEQAAIIDQKGGNCDASAVGVGGVEGDDNIVVGTGVAAANCQTTNVAVVNQQQQNQANQAQDVNEEEKKPPKEEEEKKPPKEEEKKPHKEEEKKPPKEEEKKPHKEEEKKKEVVKKEVVKKEFVKKEVVKKEFVKKEFVEKEEEEFAVRRAAAVAPVARLVSVPVARLVSAPVAPSVSIGAPRPAVLPPTGGIAMTVGVVGVLLLVGGLLVRRITR